jgi:hypothetical protein
MGGERGAMGHVSQRGWMSKRAADEHCGYGRSLRALERTNIAYLGVEDREVASVLDVGADNDAFLLEGQGLFPINRSATVVSCLQRTGGR